MVNRRQVGPVDIEKIMYVLYLVGLIRDQGPYCGEIEACCVECLNVLASSTLPTQIKWILVGKLHDGIKRSLKVSADTD